MHEGIQVVAEDAPRDVTNVAPMVLALFEGLGRFERPGLQVQDQDLLAQFLVVARLLRQLVLDAIVISELALVDADLGRLEEDTENVQDGGEGVVFGARVAIFVRDRGRGPAQLDGRKRVRTEAYMSVLGEGNWMRGGECHASRPKTKTSTQAALTASHEARGEVERNMLRAVARRGEGVGVRPPSPISGERRFKLAGGHGQDATASQAGTVAESSAGHLSWTSAVGPWGLVSPLTSRPTHAAGGGQPVSSRTLRPATQRPKRAKSSSRATRAAQMAMYDDVAVFLRLRNPMPGPGPEAAVPKRLAGP